MEKEAHSGLHDDSRSCCNVTENGAVDGGDLEIWTRLREIFLELARARFRSGSMLDVIEVGTRWYSTYCIKAGSMKNY